MQKDEITGREIPCLDHGFVRLVDFMGSDQAVVQAARVSYGEGTKQIHEDRGLIRYLLRHQHTTPFEMVEFKFHCKMPIFVARQWIRHRTASVNEYSLRYSRAINEFYVPDSGELKKQTGSNRQGRSAEKLSDAEQVKIEALLQDGIEKAWSDYEELEKTGLSRELARINLPLSLYTEWYWKINLHNLMHFLKLRIDDHAQYEIRVYAQALAQIVQQITPVCWEAFEDYVLKACTFSREESWILGQALQPSGIPVDWENLLNQTQMSKREREEFLLKIELLTHD
jgi:thymidylate synthase (FAD)